MRKILFYAASRSEMIDINKSIAMDYSNNDIQSNCICSGCFKTSLTKKYLSSLGDKSLGKLNKQHLLMGIDESKDISGLVVYLLSEKANLETDFIISVDGGFTLGTNL